ncbi:MAG: ribosome small subunit-dependent GTPase A, partial [Planctomycetes bacterium]|nr:ribosome small subunit-dependent GTPase A [Planctomycetota bacterium]
PMTSEPESPTEAATDRPNRVGRVLRVDAKVVHVDLDGETVQASPRGALFEIRGEQKNPISVGDFVEVGFDGDPIPVERVLPRRNYLGRVASAHDPREQVLVSNVDQMFIIASLSRPGFSSNRTDRILAACTWHEIPVILVLNKLDLAKPGEVEAITKTYERIPIEVIASCAIDGRGLERIAELMKDRVSVFYGPSGAGKSTLLNRIQPGLNIKEGKVSQYWKQGRHTTSYSYLHPLEMGGYAIDTPGIRAFRLFDVKGSELRDLFPDFTPFAKECHYINCSHDHEPICGVADAVEAGLLADSRYASYLDMLDEAQPENAYNPEDVVEGDPID